MVDFQKVWPLTHFFLFVQTTETTTEKQEHRQVYCARRGGPSTPSTTTDANLDCAFVENALFDTDP